MHELMQILGRNPWLAIFGVAALAIVCGTIRAVVGKASEERTRREIAAYIAEGSMTPEQGERLMASGSNKRDRCCG